MDGAANRISFLGYDVLSRLVGDTTRGACTKLDFSSAKFQLESLSGLEVFLDDNARVKSELEEVVLESNSLTSLVELSVLPRLSTVNASKNHLRFLAPSSMSPTNNGWLVRLEYLHSLDLSFNRLTSIPELTKCPNLRRLDLHHNLITPPWTQLRYGRNLELLDLSSNQLDYTNAEFAQEVKVFRALANLQELYLADNPVVLSVPNYFRYVLREVQKGSNAASICALTRIDEHKITKALKDRAAATEQKAAAEGAAMAVAVAQGGAASGGTVGLIPHLGQLNQYLEEALARPSDCVRLINLLTHDVHEVVAAKLQQPYMQVHDSLLLKHTPLQAIDDVSSIHPPTRSFEPYPREVSGNKELRDAFISTSIEEFLSNIMLLSERQPGLLQPLLRILATLSSVSFGGLGSRALEALQDLMSAGESHAEDVIATLNDVVVPALRRENDSELRRTILEGLTALATKADMPQALHALTDTLARWLQRRNDSAPTDEVLRAVAVASRHPPTAVKLGDQKAYIHVRKEFSDSSKLTERQLSLLRIVENLAKNDAFTRSGAASDVNQRSDAKKQSLLHRSAAYFVRSEIHVTALAILRSLVDDRNWGSSEKLRHISATISALSALTRNAQGLSELLKPGRGYLKLLFTLYSVPRLSPTVLTAVFRALTCTLEAPRLWFPLRYGSSEITHTAIVLEITRGLQKVVPLLQYLGEGGSRYAECCLYLGPDAEGEAHSNGQAHRLVNNHSPIMHELLVAVVELISYYCQAAKNDPRNSEEQRVAKDLNNSNRESFLFACLNTPSDTVRLAVVKCLLHVPLDEFDHAEVALLVSMLSEVTNVASGRTEHVLAFSFELLTNLCLSPSPSGKSFRQYNSHDSIHAALSVLDRNEMRDTREQPKETEEKNVLSRACVDFLRACSAFPRVRDTLRSREMMDRLTRILSLEDTFSHHFVLNPSSKLELPRVQHAAVTLEQTWTGRQVEYLLQSLVGTNALAPLGCVAPRVVRRIADVLMGLPDPSVHNLREYVDTSEYVDDQNDHNGVEISTTAEGNNTSNSNDDVSSPTSPTENGDSQTEIVNSRSKAMPSWISEMLAGRANPDVAPSELEKQATARDLRMVEFWDSSIGILQNNVEFSACSLVSESEEERGERMQQHQAFVHFRGLERLIFFMASAAEAEAAKAKTNSGITTSNRPRMKLSMISEFPDVAEKVHDAISRSKALVAGDSIHVSDEIGSSSHENGFRGPLVQARKAVGRNLLLQNYMQIDLDGKTVNSTTVYVNTVKSQVSDALGDHGEDSSRNGEADSAEVLASGLRVIFALLRFGRADTREAAIRILRQPERLALLSSICMGAEDAPLWQQGMIGAKFLAVCYEVLKMPGTRRHEVMDNVLPLYSVVSNTACRMLSTVSIHLANHKPLGPTGAATAYQCVRLLSLITSQIEYIELPLSAETELSRKAAVDTIWVSLVPFDSSIRATLSLLMYDMEQSKSARKKVNMNGQHTYLKYSGLWDSVRSQCTKFLVACLWHSHSHRYDVLESLSRAEIVKGIPIRASYVQQLLSMVAESRNVRFMHDVLSKKGYLTCSSDNISAEFLADSHSRMAAGAELVADSSSWVDCLTIPKCIGVRTNGLASAKATQTENAKRSRRVNVVIPPPPPFRTLAQCIVVRSTDRAAREHPQWQTNRIGRERVLITAWVDVVDVTASSSSPSPAVLVLTSEAYSLFSDTAQQKNVGSDQNSGYDDSYSPNPSLIWRREYNCIERIIPGLHGQRLHIVHSSPRDQTDEPATTITILVHKTDLTEEICSTMLSLSHEWRSIARSLSNASTSADDVEPERDGTLKLALLDVSHAVHNLLNHDEPPGNIGFTEVTLFSENNNSSERAALLMTDCAIAILHCDWSSWAPESTITQDYAMRKSEIIRSQDEESKRLRSLELPPAETEKKIRELVKSMDDDLRDLERLRDDKLAIERERTKSLLRLGVRRSQPLAFTKKDLLEVAFGTGPIPTLSLGFKSASNTSKKSVSSWGWGTTTPNPVGKDDESFASTFVDIAFADDIAREQWRRALYVVMRQYSFFKK